METVDVVEHPSEIVLISVGPANDVSSGVVLLESDTFPIDKFQKLFTDC